MGMEPGNYGNWPGLYGKAQPNMSIAAKWELVLTFFTTRGARQKNDIINGLSLLSVDEKGDPIEDCKGSVCVPACMRTP